ncbi:hypothetical protein MOF01_07950 [Bacillus spizizenii]|nr:hypothetical protein [Bacillus spizizenii]
MTLPEQIMINSIPYKVLQVDGFIEEDQKGGVQLGDINPWKQEIQVSKEAEGEYAAKILLHEAIHGILSEYGLDRINNEGTVSVLTAGFYDFIKSNDLTFIQERRRPYKGFMKGSEVGSGSILATIQRNERISPIKVSNAIGTAVEGSIQKVMETNEANAKKIIDSTLRGVIEDTEDNQNNESRPRRLPYVGYSRSSFPIGEQMSEKLEKAKKIAMNQVTAEATEADPEHWETGVKERDGENHYRTYFECPNCRKTGKRYVTKNTEFVHCRKCDTKLKKVDATEAGFPERDTFGNFFRAYELYEEGAE